MHRREKGWGSAGEYVNATGRNDIVAAKVAYDAENVYFYVRTKEAITNWRDAGWMRLFVDADCDKRTGWEGYDYLVNAEVLSGFSTTLAERAAGGGWNRSGRCGYRVKGNEMELRVGRERIGQGGKVRFDFHWADNMQKEDDIIEFAVSGDSAPNRRFDYRYTE